MESSSEPENADDSSSAPRPGLRLMIIIVAGVALVAIYANIQSARRDQIERVTITPVSTATPAAALRDR